jgi:hypothetical protein
MPADGILKNNVATKFLMGSPLCIDGELAFEEHIRIASVFILKVLKTAFKSNRKQIVFS